MRVLKGSRSDFNEPKPAEPAGGSRPAPLAGGSRPPFGFHPDVPTPRPTEEAPAPAPQPPAQLDDDQGNTLIVGPNIKLKGEITACDTLVVEGNIEASMDSRLIRVAESGVFVGEASVDTAEVAGVFDGTITVRERLIVRSTGRITGTVRYGRLEVEGGGRLEGDVRLLDKAAIRTAAQTPRKEPATESHDPTPVEAKQATS